MGCHPVPSCIVVHLLFPHLQLTHCTAGAPFLHIFHLVFVFFSAPLCFETICFETTDTQSKASMVVARSVKQVVRIMHQELEGGGGEDCPTCKTGHAGALVVPATDDRYLYPCAKQLTRLYLRLQLWKVELREDQ